MRLFISYRRNDTEAQTTELIEGLTRFSTPDHPIDVFRDRENIGPGEDFIERIETHLPSADAVLAVVGRSSFQARQGTDWFRLELTKALNLRSLPIVIVLVNGATLPPAETLMDLAGLGSARRMVLRQGRDGKLIPAEIERLVRDLREMGIGRTRAGEKEEPARLVFSDARYSWWTRTTLVSIFVDGRLVTRVVSLVDPPPVLVPGGKRRVQVRRGVLRSPEVIVNLRAGEEQRLSYAVKPFVGITLSIA